MGRDAADSVITVAILLATVAAVLGGIYLPYVRQLDKLDFFFKPREVPTAIAKFFGPVGALFDAINDAIDKVACALGAALGRPIRAIGYFLWVAFLLSCVALVVFSVIKFIKWAWYF